jgi:hypothetical protein
MVATRGRADGMTVAKRKTPSLEASMTSHGFTPDVDGPNIRHSLPLDFDSAITSRLSARYRTLHLSAFFLRLAGGALGP